MATSTSLPAVIGRSMGPSAVVATLKRSFGVAPRKLRDSKKALPLCNGHHCLTRQMGLNCADLREGLVQRGYLPKGTAITCRELDSQLYF